MSNPVDPHDQDVAILRIIATAILAMVFGLVLLYAPSSPASGTANTTSTASAQLDPWGVYKLWPDRPGGRAWYSDWDDHRPDRWETWVETGGAHVVYAEDGVMEIGGDTVRMYVLDPKREEQWTGALEVTVYARRVPGAPAGDPWSGIVTAVRTNHGSAGTLDADPCDSRGLLARLRFDGLADFGKEVRHPDTVARNARRIWKGGMPEGVWIGYKHLVYDTEDGVVQELWVDFPDNGEHWKRVNRVVDHGKSWGDSEAPCHDGIDPALPLRGGTQREGSETGRPNVAVLFRADSLIATGGLEYRWASVREVH